MRLKFFAILFLITALAFDVSWVLADTMKERRDAQGNVVEKQYYRCDGSLEQGIKYNKLGKKIEEAYYGRNGRLRDNPDGWALIKRKYEGGQIAEESYYGADGHLKERKQYNELGDLVAKQYVGDGSIDPSEELNPMPTLAGETTSYYDSYDRPEGEMSVIRE